MPYKVTVTKFTKLDAAEIMSAAWKKHDAKLTGSDKDEKDDLHAARQDLEAALDTMLLTFVTEEKHYFRELIQAHQEGKKISADAQKQIAIIEAMKPEDRAKPINVSGIKRITQWLNNAADELKDMDDSLAQMRRDMAQHTGARDKLGMPKRAIEILGPELERELTKKLQTQRAPLIEMGKATGDSATKVAEFGKRVALMAKVAERATDGNKVVLQDLAKEIKALNDDIDELDSNPRSYKLPDDNAIKADIKQLEKAELVKDVEFTDRKIKGLVARAATVKARIKTIQTTEKKFLSGREGVADLPGIAAELKKIRDRLEAKNTEVLALEKLLETAGEAVTAAEKRLSFKGAKPNPGKDAGKVAIGSNRKKA